MSNVLFIQVNPWITRRKRAVSMSHGRGGGRLAGWCAGDVGSPVPHGGAAATSNPTGVAWKGDI